MEAVGSASGSEITVTAVVVDLDGGEMLGESLTSLFAQTHPGLEVILVDNGSTDGAAERARDVYGDRLVYLRNERILRPRPGRRFWVRCHGLSLSQVAKSARSVTHTGAMRL